MKSIAVLLIVGMCIIAGLYTFEPKTQTLQFRPKEYDLTLTSQATQCQLTELNEGLCQGANWAQTFSQALYLTYCLQYYDTVPELSAQQLLQCADVKANGKGDVCEHVITDLNDVESIGFYLQTEGLDYSSCLPYSEQLTFNLKQQCPSTCADGSTPIQQSIVASDFYQLTDIADIQDHILNAGPIVIAIKNKPSLNYYTNGIYNGSADEKLDFGYRFLEIVGWSTLNTSEVIWKTVHTFGSQYGIQGRVTISSKNPLLSGYYAFDVEIAF
ncbi:hypothetical protein pb186bvf_005086 [Paramecium bursaria]